MTRVHLKLPDDDWSEVAHYLGTQGFANFTEIVYAGIDNHWSITVQDDLAAAVIALRFQTVSQSRLDRLLMVAEAERQARGDHTSQWLREAVRVIRARQVKERKLLEREIIQRLTTVGNTGQ